MLRQPFSIDTASRLMIHPQALVETGAVIGERTRVWAFAHVLANVVIGEDCNICDHTFIESDVHLGNRVTVKCGVYLWAGLTAEDDVFIGPCAAFTNDLRPRSRRHQTAPLQTLLRQGCSVGANATLLPGLVVGAWAMVAAGAMVTANVPDYALMVGHPARQRGWVCRCGERLGEVTPAAPVLCSCGLAYQLFGKTLTPA